MKFGRYFFSYLFAVLIWTVVLYMNTFFPTGFLVTLVLIPISVFAIAISTYFYFIANQGGRAEQ